MGRKTSAVLALVFLTSAALAATEGEGGLTLAKPEAVATGVNCGSLVIRDCRMRLPSVLADSGERLLGGAPVEWEAVLIAGPDAVEIVVTGERIREATLREVFERYLGAPVGSMGALVSRQAAGGARCTAVSRSGATLCSSSAGVLPGMGTPVTSWSFSF